MTQVYINHSLDEIKFTHEYNVLDEDKISYLFRSNSSEWTEEAKGNLVVSLEDTTDGYVIRAEGHKKIKLGYHELQELFILLLHTQNDNEIEFRESKTTMKWPL